MRALGQGSLASYIKLTLDVIWVLLWIAAIGLGLSLIGYGVTLLGGHFGWWPNTVLGDGAQVGADGGVIKTNGKFSLDHPHLFAPAIIAAGVVVGGGLIIVKQLKTLFASFTSGEPFRRENAHCLRVIWVTLLSVELARMALGFATGALISHLGLPGDAAVRLDVRIAVSTWIAIIVLIVLAEVFREGARLKDEQDLTI
jgi:hypothetical protein